MATAVRIARPAASSAVVVCPARPPVRTPRRRPVRRPPVRRRRPVRVGRRRGVLVRRGRRRQGQVPGWVVVAGALAVLLLAGRGVAEVAAPPAPAAAGGAVCTTAAGPVGPVAGFAGSQLANAAAIVAVGREMGVPQRGQVIAVATAMQEAKLRMYANAGDPASLALPHEVVGSDHDSVGLFQQRAAGWGPLEQRMDPRGSARTFYERLTALPGWQSMPLTEAAQAVQISAYPDRYAQWEGPATAVVAAVGGGITCTPTT